jgi:TrmH family RNA methyltransferase
MNEKRIYTKNALYQEIAALKTNRSKRQKTGQFFVEGVRNINSAIANGWEAACFLYPLGRELSRWAKGILSSVPSDANYALSSELMAGISGKSDASELCLIAKKRPGPPLPQSKELLAALFDRPSNHGNLGTLMRSLDAFGASELAVAGHAIDIYDPSVVASSMGSFFAVKARQLSSNEEIDSYFSSLREKNPGLLIVGTTARKQAPVDTLDLSGPLLLLIGNESDGLSWRMKHCCDALATIPMAGESTASSLNAAVAASIFLYEASRQRAEK